VTEGRGAAPIGRVDATGGRPPTSPRRDARWVLVLAVVAVLLTAFNLRPAVTSLGSLLPEVREGTGTSVATAGLLTSLPPICFGLAALVGARLGRRFGTATTLLAAMAAAGLLLAGRATSSTTSALLLWTVAALVALGLGNVLLPVAVKRWFPGRVGGATGWYALALAAGTAAAAGLSVPLAEATGGWRVGLGAWAVPALVAAVPWWWLRDRRGSVATATAEEVAAAAATARRVRRAPRAWALGGYFGFQSTVAYVVMGWLPSIYRDAGLTPSTSGGLLALVMIVGGPVSLLVPTLAGRREDQRGLVVTMVIAAAAGFGGLLLAPTTVPWVWALLLGIGMGAFPLSLALIGLRAGTAAGTASLSSVTQGIGYLLAAAGPVLIGVLRDATGGWRAPLAVVLGLLVPQLLCGLVAARPGVLDR
jgi:MFS transporter, CP family, cyanate transporter